MQMEENTLYFAKVRPTAQIPSRDEENAGYDIYADFEAEEIVINSLDTVKVPTGVAAAVSINWYLQVEERGSTGGSGIKKSAGVVDSSYRGEIFIAITNSTNKTLRITKAVTDKVETDDEILYPYSKAIAQLVLHRVHNEVKEKEISYEELKAFPSKRGTGALGSSGK